MSASATIARGQYKDQLKSMRAETIITWMTSALDFTVEVLRGQPTEYVRDEEEAARKRWYGAFY
jgi:hypothetical protein